MIYGTTHCDHHATLCHSKILARARFGMQHAGVKPLTSADNDVWSDVADPCDCESRGQISTATIRLSGRSEPFMLTTISRRTTCWGSEKARHTMSWWRNGTRGKRLDRGPLLRLDESAVMWVKKFFKNALLF